ncbi:MAG TPA: ATP-binding protein [Stellaceae bacterium]|nr:ATP-binding protein [Stellaceae bacterium]
MGFEADALRLRTALRDLVALSTVPAVWVGREPPAIAAGLADVLVNSLYLDFAFVRLCDPNGGAAVEIARGSAWQAFPEWLQQYLSVNGCLSRREVVRDIGSAAQRCRGIVIPVGVDAAGGLVAAACDRADFPSEIDQLLLSVAANQAATAFRTARLLDAHRRAEEAIRESEQQLRIARDELETKVAERTAELQRSEAYLTEAQRLSHTGSWACVPASGKHTYWSEEIFHITGFDPAEGPPRFEKFERRIHPDDRARTRENFRTAIRGKVDIDHSYRIVHPGGEIREIHVIGHPVLGPSGDLVEFVGTLMDVTERRRAEEERQALAHANRITTMGQLTASIAHEVNQPIAAVVTNAQAALRWLNMQPSDPEEVRQALDRIVKAGRRAGDVVSRMRALVRKVPPRRDQLDINEVIREVIALTHSELHRSGTSLQTQLADGLPLVPGDRIQLQQVVLNLILNAVEAMSGSDEGSRDLLISTEEDEADGVRIAVQDWGPGLTPESLGRLFDTFYTTKPDGMGMGLAICRSIIEAHGGRVWATPNAPQGAVLQFTLPRHGRAA